MAVFLFPKYKKQFPKILYTIDFISLGRLLILSSFTNSIYVLHSLYSPLLYKFSIFSISLSGSSIDCFSTADCIASNLLIIVVDTDSFLLF